MPRIFEEGEVIHGANSYTVVRAKPDQVHFAQGGQGTLYKVKVDEDPSNIILLKQISDPTAKSPGGRAFLDRYKKMKSIFETMPTFVPVIHDIFENDDIFFICYELLKGTSLYDMLIGWGEGSLTLEESQRKVICLVMAYTLASVHEHGVVHLDLKPENVFVEERGPNSYRTRLIDFSSAIVQGAPMPESICGTPGYWTPEHTRPDNHNHVSEKSDVFTLGIMLFPLLTEQAWSPYQWDGDIELYNQQIQNHQAAKAIDLNPALPGGKEVSDLIWSMISPNPDDRPTAKEVHKTLMSTIGIKPAAPSTKPAPKPEPKPEPKPAATPVPSAGRPEPVEEAEPVVPRSRGTMTLTIGSATVSFDEDFILGRKEFRGHKGYEFINRNHARVFFDAKAGTWVISQLRDTVNETKVNDTVCRKYQRLPVKDGDTISIGLFKAQVSIA